MIVGFNTDIKHRGRVYHCQTEDKGRDNPLIETLVYRGGEILAARRSSYEDLRPGGFDEADVVIAATGVPRSAASRTSRNAENTVSELPTTSSATAAATSARAALAVAGSSVSP